MQCRCYCCCLRILWYAVLSIQLAPRSAWQTSPTPSPSFRTGRCPFAVFTLTRFDGLSCHLGGSSREPPAPTESWIEEHVEVPAPHFQMFDAQRLPGLAAVRLEAAILAQRHNRKREVNATLLKARTPRIRSRTCGLMGPKSWSATVVALYVDLCPQCGPEAAVRAGPGQIGHRCWISTSAPPGRLPRGLLSALEIRIPRVARGQPAGYLGTHHACT